MFDRVVGGRPTFIAGQNFADKVKLRLTRQQTLSRVDTWSELLSFVKLIEQKVKCETQKLKDKIKRRMRALRDDNDDWNTLFSISAR
jgi:hypothetical protein